MTTMEEFLSTLDKDTQKDVQIASQVKVERQPLPSIGLTRQLQGGLKYGAEHLFWGPTGSGKTMAAYQTLALAQQAGKKCALVDAEGAFTVEWAEQLGIDTKKLLIIEKKQMSVVTDRVVKMIQKGIDFVLIDSISGLQPPSYFDKDNQPKAAADTGAISGHAKGVATMLNLIGTVNRETLVLLISQQTTNITPHGGIQQPHGGNKVKHLVTTSVKFGSNLAEKERIMGNVTEGDMIFSRVTGRPVTWLIDKDRGPGMHTKGGYNIYFTGDFVGIDNVSELVDYGVEYGLIRKDGSWLTVYEHREQGRDKMIAYVRANQVVRDTLESELLAR